MDSRSRAAVLVASAAFLWGTSFPVIKVALGGAHDEVSFSFVISAVRLSLAAVLGLCVLRAMRTLDWSLFREPVVWLLGGLNALSFGAQHLGISYTTASKTALLVNFSVVFVAVLGFLFFGERLGKGKVAGVAMGVIGLVIVATGLDPSFLNQGEVAGDALVIAAGFLWSLYILHTKKAIDRGLDYVGLSVAILATTSLFLLIPLPFVDVTQPVALSGWAGIAYLGAVSTLLPLVLWSRALKDTTAVTSSILLLLEVFFAVMLSIVFLGEEFLPVYMLGGALILAGGILAGIGEQPTQSVARRTTGEN